MEILVSHRQIRFHLESTCTWLSVSLRTRGCPPSTLLLMMWCHPLEPQMPWGPHQLRHPVLKSQHNQLHLDGSGDRIRVPPAQPDGPRVLVSITILQNIDRVNYLDFDQFFDAVSDPYMLEAFR